MKYIENDIRVFMLKAEQFCPERPTIPTLDIRRLRAQLIMEEALEQCEALGVTPHIETSAGTFLVSEQTLRFYRGPEPSLVEIADSTADQVYVSVGCAIACGIEMEPIWKLVQDSNLAKFGPGSYRREDGKQMKPPGWKAPTEGIEQALKDQG